ncbi:MAG: hypothetical protein AAFR77_16175 [Cyanobacteria bacterium J06631_2]
MNTDTVQFEFFEGFDSDNPRTVGARTTDLGTRSLAQITAGYFPVNTGGSDDVRFLEFNFIPGLAEVFESGSGTIPLEVVSSDNFADLELEIAEQEDLGFELTEFNYSEGLDTPGNWNAFFSEDPTNVSYSSSEDVLEFTEQIDEQFEDGINLTNIEYGDETWAATFDDSQTISGSGYARNDDFDDLTGQIEEFADDGFALIDLEFGDGTWFAVFTENPGTASYTTSEDFEIFQEQIETQQEDGLDLVDVTFAQGAWYGVFNETLEDDTLVRTTRSDLATIDDTLFGDVFGDLG